VQNEVAGRYLGSLLTYLIENAVGQTHGDRMQGLIMIAECVHIPEARCRKYNSQHIAYSHPWGERGRKWKLEIMVMLMQINLMILM